MQKINTCQQSFDISLFDNIYHKNYTAHILSFVELFDFLSAQYVSTINKQYTKLSTVSTSVMIAGKFKPNIDTFTSNNLLNRTLITLDMDGYEGNQHSLEQDLIDCFGQYNFIAYSTSSSTLDKPRCRVILPLDIPILTKKYRPFIDSFINELTNDAIITACTIKDSKASRTTNKMMHLPFHPTYNTYNPFLIFNDGFNVPCRIPMKEECEDVFKYKKHPLPNYNIEKVKGILEQYDVEETDYNEWYQCCQAIHHQFEGGEEGLDIFLWWSSKDSRFNKDKATEKYMTVDKNECEDPITFATIVQIVSNNKKFLLRNELQKGNCLDSKEIFPVDEWTHVRGIKSLRPISSDENFSQLVKAYGIDLYNDVVLKDVVCKYKGDLWGLDEILGKINSIMEINNFTKTAADLRVKSYVYKIEKNLWKDWVLSKKWDGISRIEDFYNTVEVKPEHENIKRLYLRKWIMQMLHISCFNEAPRGKQARAVLVFQGKDEGSQKTAWLKNLAPDHFQNYVVTGKQGALNSDMNIKDIVSCVMCELGELDGMFKKSDIAALKNFISREEDSLNRKWGKSHSIYRRRTAFFATVNKVDFLNNEEQNTRFWVIPVIKCNGYYKTDIQQLYAEFIEKHFDDIYWLEGEEKQNLITANKFFGTICPIVEMFSNSFDVEAQDIEKYVWMNCTEALRSSFYKGNINRKDLSAMRKYFDDNYKYNTKKGKWLIPPLKSDKNIKSIKSDQLFNKENN